jgi:transposase
MPAPKKYDEETQARAVRMYRDRLAEGDVSQLAARREVGELLGVNQSTLRNWIRREDGTASAPAAGNPGGETIEQENARLRRENARLRRANEILKTSSAFFAAAELDRQLGNL